jgi:hypothetical protein
MSEQPSLEPTRNGWIVEALVPKLNAAEPSQMVFAASIEDADAAVDAVRRAVGGLRCDIEARIRLSPRALAQLAVRPGEVKSL